MRRRLNQGNGTGRNRCMTRAVAIGIRSSNLSILMLLCAVCCGCGTKPKRESDRQRDTATKDTAPALSPSANKPPQAGDETTEPKLGFTVRIGESEVHLSEGDQLPAKGTFTDPSVSVTVDPERVFTHAGMSFSYPRHFAFEADLSDAASHSWTLSGNDVKIMIFRFATELSVDAFVKELTDGFGSKSTISPVLIELGPRQYAGRRIRAVLATHEFTQDVFALPSVKGRARILVVQDDASGNKPESQPTRALLAKTFQITQ